MRKGFTFLPALALSLAISLPGASVAEPDATTVVATVNGQDITIGHMIIAHATLPQQYRQLPPDVLYNAILDQLIQQTALAQTFEGDLPGHVALSLENERRSLVAGEQVEAIMQGAASDEDIQAAYDAQYADGTGGDEFNASHILVESKEEADEIKAELDDGANFAETAKARSTGPSGPNGGELGWFGTGAMVPEFEQAVIALDVAQVSEPVQTQFGWHVIRLNDKRQSEAPPLEAVREELASELRQQAVRDKVEELTAAATIERPDVDGLNPEIIRNIDMVRQ
ncbi:MAG: peptidylprolyl isomerase [Arenibacterium sp.]